MGQRPLGREGDAFRQSERGASLDHAGQPPLAPAEIIDEPDTAFADKSSALRDAGKKEGQRGLPRPRHHQGLAIAFPAQPQGQRMMLAQRETPARQIGNDAFAHARHIVEQGRNHRSRQHIDRAVGEALLKQLDHGVAAHEIPDPHVGD